MKQVRTRFAPSPTGIMHIGGIRTALFSWLIARKTGGQFILRIEDTDKKREQDGSVDHIIESLRWLGIEWDEGPEIGGNHGPYLQSERLDKYRVLVQLLLDEGKAYVDETTPDQVNEWRQQAQSSKQAFLFRNHRESADKGGAWDGHKPVRLRIDEIKRTNWHDVSRGDLSAGEEALDDFIIMKADGYPTYNFAHVVDDHDMEITHVIRGEEFIASTPKFIALHEALGYDLPIFVTAPPILNANGGKKLSKRDGAKDALEYRDEGYTKEGVLNFLASMGWNDGTEQEVFSPEELIAKFELERIQRSGAKFDDERLDWLNGHHIRNTSLDDLYGTIDAKFWPEESTDYDDQYKKTVLGLVHERLKFFAELSELTIFFFKEPAPAKEIMINKKLDEVTAIKFIDATIEALNAIDFSEDSIEETLRGLVSTLDTKTGLLFKLIRASVTGSLIAPGLFETVNVIGKDKVLTRLAAARKSL